jgi:hypothetical protein
MEHIMRVADLRKELEDLPDDAPVMIAVVKYPNEFALKATPEGKWRWDLSTDVEVHPLEHEEVTLVDGQVLLTVELEEYDEARAQLDAASADQAD